MMHSLKLTALIFATSSAGLLHAGDYRHDIDRAAHNSHRSSGVQTAGLFDLFRGYGTSARYSSSHTTGYGNSGRSNSGNAGYGNTSYGNTGYRSTGYRPATNHYRSKQYAPAYRRGYTNSGYDGNSRYGGNAGSGYGTRYSSGCNLPAHGGGGGYYGR